MAASCRAGADRDAVVACRAGDDRDAVVACRAGDDRDAVVAGLPVERCWLLLPHRGPGPGPRAAIVLGRFPFRIGRQSTNELTLGVSEISRSHAEIVEHDGQLWLRDCGSTNGTFVNHDRLLQPATLKPGDLLHFGPLGFRLEYRHAGAAGRPEPTQTRPQARPGRGADAAAIMTLPGVPVAVADSGTGRTSQADNQIATPEQVRFREMLRQRSIVPCFQPMYSLGSNELVSYEILGRCHFAGLPSEPALVFGLTDDADQQIALSELFREIGLRQATALGNRHRLFLNAAPAEVEPFRLAVSLATLRHYAPDLPLVLEISENAITGRRMLRNLRSLLDDLGMEMAYDDFGVGQARFLELIDESPDWIKFDLMMIHSLRHDNARTRIILQALVGMMRDLGIRTVAEGIETEADLAACRELGFDVGQGYYFGRPVPFLAQR